MANSPSASMGPVKRFYVLYAWADETDRTREEKVDALCEDAKKPWLIDYTGQNKARSGRCDFRIHGRNCGGGGFRREVQPRRQHWFLNEKSGFPFRTPAFCSVSRGRRRLGEKEYRAPSVTPGVALRPRTQEGDKVFIFISEKYLRSLSCMFELFAMWRRSAQKPNEFRRRVRFFTLDGVKIVEPEDWLESAGYWKAKRERLGLTIDSTGWQDAGVEAIKKYFMVNEFAGSISNVLALFADTVQPRTFEEFLRYGFDDAPGSVGSGPKAITDFDLKGPDPGRNEPPPPTMTLSVQTEFTETPPPAPPVSAEPIDRADLNKGRFGGSSGKNGLRLRRELS